MSGQMGDCCVSGVRHEGTPTGEIKFIGDTRCYISRPADGSTRNCLLFLPDAFGIDLINNQLLADDFARNGLFTVMPDYFEGDPFPVEALEPAKSEERPLIDRVKGAIAETLTIPIWLGRHPESKVRPIVDQVVASVKAEFNPSKLLAVGYCFGGKYVFQLARDGVIAGGATAHPSLVTLDDVKGIQVPVSIAAAETDAIYVPELKEQVETVLKNSGAKFETITYQGVTHGFAVRSDITVEANRVAKENAFAQFVKFFQPLL